MVETAVHNVKYPAALIPLQKAQVMIADEDFKSIFSLDSKRSFKHSCVPVQCLSVSWAANEHNFKVLILFSWAQVTTFRDFSFRGSIIRFLFSIYYCCNYIVYKKY